MSTCPPTPSLEDLMDYRSDPEAIRVAAQLKRDLQRATLGIHLETLFAAAHHRFPDDAPVQALKKFALETTATIFDLDRVGDDAVSLIAAEQDRLKPLMSAAIKRLWIVVERMNSIPRLISHAESSALQKRKDLKLLGVEDPATLERAAPMPDYAGFNDEQRVLRAEIALLEEFIRTGNESVLPPGIVPLAPARVESPHVEQKSRLAKLAEEVAQFIVLPAGH